ncbi:MAG: PAS domain S-box protein, partial [Desulfobacteraceae bacterium]
MESQDLNVNLAAKIHKLKKELNLFRMSIENAQHLFFITDFNSKIIYANSAFLNFTGYHYDEILGEKPNILKSSEMPDAYYKELWETIKTGESWQEEIINKKKNGEKYCAFQIITPVKGTNGRIENFVSIQHDITEQKENQQKLQEVLSEYNTIFTNTLDAVFLINVDANKKFRFSRLNPTHEKLTGLSTKEIKNKTPEEILGEKTGSAVSANYMKCLKAEKPIEYEELLDLPGGRKIWQTRLTPVFYGSDIKEILGTSREITREKELSKERDMFFEVSLDMICIATTDAYFKQLSPMWSKTLGWSEQELKSRPYMEFIHPDDVEKTRKAALNLLQGKNTQSFENRFLKKDNTYNWLSWNSFADQEEGLIYAVARDIQEQKKTEQKLIRMSQTDPMLKISNR